MSHANYVDILITLGLLWAAWRGWSSGLLRSVAGLVGLLVGYFAAFALGHRVGGLITASDDPSAGAVLVGFILVFLGTLILFYFLGRFLRAYLHATPLGIADSVAGGALGAVKGVLLFGLLLMLLLAHPVSDGIRGTVDRSRLSAPVQRWAVVLVDLIRSVAPRAGDLLKKLGVEPPATPPAVLNKLSEQAGQAGTRIEGLVNESRKRLDK